MNNFYVEELYAQKVADMSNVPVEYILKLRDMGLLDTKNIRDMLIRHDCLALLKTNKFTAPQIYEYLGGLYSLNTAQVQRITKLKSQKLFYCKRCGIEIKPSTYKKNNGKCRNCLSQTSII